MEELDFCKGLRSYGVYHFDKFPDWNILLTDFSKDCNGKNVLEGLCFSLDGRFETACSITLPLVGKEIGYIYIPNKAFSLYLEFHNRWKVAFMGHFIATSVPQKKDNLWK